MADNIIKWKNRGTGQIVTAPFPAVADDRGNVAYTDDKGHEEHTAIADFLAYFTQAIDLPKVDAKNLTPQEVVRTPGSPIATPAAPPSSPFAELERSIKTHVENLFGKLVAEIHSVKDSVTRVEEAHPKILAAVEGLAAQVPAIQKVGALVEAVHKVVVPPESPPRA